MTPGGNHRPPPAVLPEPLTAALRSVRADSDLVVALSGGLDSVLLLHAAAAIHQHSGRNLSAIHINHQLQSNAAEMEQFCRALCADLQVPLTVERVEVPLSANELARAGGLEENARDARYRAFDQHLNDGEILLLAHHGDDQLETVLFRLLRGTGVAGLGGMPRERALGRGRLYRPLLAFSRHQLEQWACDLQINWVDDPSNVDHIYDRNFLRGVVIPPLKARWPNLLRRVQGTSDACRESEELAASLARIHYQKSGGCGGQVACGRPPQLDRGGAEKSATLVGRAVRRLPRPHTDKLARDAAGFVVGGP
ncbi:tRNA lysidine(34) synthetase TilS [Marinobacter sp. X15-166B]|uniref:tRNA lysidine(34) synthetase TilS n=1 Tax=Marinobacter sp. X15-166B TaxID=1897620 RepID=UPI000A9CA223|nr:tRNA lysidine(34) synthetase TilS [Marinobacter sp. X15-166B]